MRWGVWLLGLSALAQTQPDEFKISADVERVVLGVAVKDGHGAPVGGLTQKDFIVYEDGRPREIRSFSSEDAPVTVGLLLDNSGSMQRKRPETNLAALQFIQASNPADEVFVVNFNDTVRLGLPENILFSHDLNQLRAALDTAKPAGKTSLYDAIGMALDHVAKGRHEKKALLVISDGGDNASRATLDSILEKAKSSNAIIYTVGIYDDDDADKNPGVLKKLATITGGETFRPEKLADIRHTTTKIARDIRSQYTIGYAPAGGAADGRYHRIRVVASAPDRGKLTVRTREGYVAPSATARSSDKQGVDQNAASDAAGGDPK